MIFLRSTVLFVVLFLPALAHASELILKSGQKVEGKIIEQTDKYVNIDAGVGVAMTYYTDEIDTIDGQKVITPPKTIVPMRPIEVSPPAAISQDTNPKPTIEPSEQQVSNIARPTVEAPTGTENQIKTVSTPSVSTLDASSKQAAQKETTSIQQEDSYPYIGFWETSCSNNSGLSIDKAGSGLYSVSFCFPQSCPFKPGTYRPNTTLVNDLNYNIIDANTIEIKGMGGTTKYYRCSSQPRKYEEKKEHGNWIINIIGILYFIGYVSGLHRLAKKCKVSNGWLAWVPFADFYVKCRIGEKPWWWFIPFYGYSIWLGLFGKSFGLFIFILILPIFIVDLKVWIGILKKFYKSLWWLWCIYLLGGPLIPIWYLVTRKDDV